MVEKEILGVYLGEVSNSVNLKEATRTVKNPTSSNKMSLKNKRKHVRVGPFIC